MAFDPTTSSTFYRDFIQQPDHGDFFAQAKGLIKTSIDFFTHDPSARTTHRNLKRSFYTLNDIIDNLKQTLMNREQEMHSNLSTSHNPSLTQSQPFPSDKFDALLHSISELNSNLAKKDAEPGKTKRRARAKRPRSLSVPEKNTTVATQSTSPSHSIEMPAHRKPCPKVVFIDSRTELTNDQFRDKLVEAFPELDLPMKRLSLSFNKRKTLSYHKFVITPWAYKFLCEQKETGTDRAKKFNLYFELDLLTQQCTTCFQYGHGKSAHPLNLSSVCGRCGKAELNGPHRKCTGTIKCSQCNMVGHGPTSSVCPARVRQMDIDRKLYDLESDQKTISEHAPKSGNRTPVASSSSRPGSFLDQARNSMSYN